MLCDHFKKKKKSIAEKSCHITKFLVRYEKIASSSELCTLFTFVLWREVSRELQFYFFLIPCDGGNAVRREFLRMLTNMFFKSPINEFAKLVIGKKLLAFY